MKVDFCGIRFWFGDPCQKFTAPIMRFEFCQHNATTEKHWISNEGGGFGEDVIFRVHTQITKDRREFSNFVLNENSTGLAHLAASSHKALSAGGCGTEP